MRPTRSNLIALIILFIISGASLGYLFYAPEPLTPSSEYLKLRTQANSGDPMSEMTLGTRLILFSENTQEGLYWMRKSSDHGNPIAQCFLGVAYMEGDNVEKDTAKGIAYYRLAAAQGYGPAQSRLGRCYTFGEGVEKDPKEALSWFRLAATQGDEISMGFIGSMYFYGVCVEQDSTQAYKWFRDSAELGHSPAQYYLADLLSRGDGCIKDEVEAYAWYKIVADDDPDAVKKLNELRKKIDAEQISDAMKRVAILKSGIASALKKQQETLFPK